MSSTGSLDPTTTTKRKAGDICNDESSSNQKDKAEQQTDEANSKRSRCLDEQNDTNQENKSVENENNKNDEVIIDVAKSLGYKDGERLQVHWTVIDNDGDGRDDDDDDEANEDSSSNSNRHSRWWGATLLKYDGRMEDNVAIRVLEYDPYPEGGFPNSSREDVVFIGPNLLLTYPDASQELQFRKEGEESTEDIDDDNNSSSDVLYLGEDDIRNELDSILKNALTKHSKAWNMIPPSQQAKIADSIAQKKEVLLDAIKGHTSDIITSCDMKNILQQVLEGK